MGREVASAQEHGVTPGGQRADCGLRRVVPVGNRSHLEVIADDEALESKFLAQETLDNRSRQRGWLLLIQSRHEHVRRHDRVDVGVDGCAKRDELDRSQPVWWMFDERQLEVRIGARIPMAREMLPARGNSLTLQLSYNDRTQAGDLIGAFGKGAIANDRVTRVRMNVEDGRVVERNANRAQLTRHRLRKPNRQPLVIGTPQDGHGRPLCKWSTQSRDATTLLIDGHPRGPLQSEMPRIVRQLGNLLGRCNVPGEECNPSQIELARERSQLWWNGSAPRSFR